MVEVACKTRERRVCNQLEWLRRLGAGLRRKRDQKERTHSQYFLHLVPPREKCERVTNSVTREFIRLSEPSQQHNVCSQFPISRSSNVPRTGPDRGSPTNCLL